MASVKHLKKYNVIQRKEARDNYYKNPNRCKCCNEIIEVKNHEKPCVAMKKKFCGHSCAAKFNNLNSAGKKPKKKKFCLNCNKELVNAQKKYCSHNCISAYTYKKYISDWKKGLVDGSTGKTGYLHEQVKKYIRIKYEYKCAECGWCKVNKVTGRSPLAVHHRDGNWRNNKESNLILVCPNCHSLTGTYCSLNNGKGRQRKKCKRQG